MAERKNWGGARPGAGRKPRQKPPEKLPDEPVSPDSEHQKRLDALEFLENVVNDPKAPLQQRVRAAIAAAQYRHMKKGDGGKKDEQAERAKKAGGGKFAPTEPPKLAAANGKRV